MHRMRLTDMYLIRCRGRTSRSSRREIGHVRGVRRGRRPLIAGGALERGVKALFDAKGIGVVFATAVDLVTGGGAMIVAIARVTEREKIATEARVTGRRERIEFVGVAEEAGVSDIQTQELSRHTKD
jgi:hypothetical protein